jgi:hypothetical protein
MWIKVNKKEPPKDIPLIVTNGKKVIVMRRGPADDKPDGLWYSTDEWEDPWEYKTVTHWMRLPSPPKLMIKKFIAHIWPKRKIRKDFAIVSYHDAEALLEKGWTLAKEEDRNRVFGYVCLELLEDVSAVPI